MGSLGKRKNFVKTEKCKKLEINDKFFKKKKKKKQSMKTKESQKIKNFNFASSIFTFKTTHYLISLFSVVSKKV
jgi:hypothetical protein